MNNNKALITGASGFIGSHLSDRLLAEGWEVHCLVRPSSDLKWLDTSRIHIHKIALSDCDGLKSILEPVQTVFHCAGVTKSKTRKGYFDINADICRPFYESCKRYGKNLEAVIHLSSLASVGPAGVDQEVTEQTPCHPVTFYGKSKRAGEEIALEYADALPVIILRPPVVYGERELNFFTFLKSIHNGWNIKIGNSPKTLSLIHAHDLVDAMIAAATQPIPEQRVFFTTDGRNYSWEEVTETASKILNVRPKTLAIPESLLHFVALMSEGWSWFGDSAALIDRQRVIDIRQSSWTASSQAFFDQYDFQPRYDLNRGLETTLNWYHEQGWLR